MACGDLGVCVALQPCGHEVCAPGPWVLSRGAVRTKQGTASADSRTRTAGRMLARGALRFASAIVNRTGLTFWDLSVAGTTVTRYVDPRAGVLRVAPNGRATQLLSAEQLALAAASAEQGGAPTAPYASHRWSVFPGSAHDLVLGESEE